MKEKEIKIFAGVFIALLILFFVTRPRHSTVRIENSYKPFLSAWLPRMWRPSRCPNTPALKDAPR